MIGLHAYLARINNTRLNETNIQNIRPIPGVTNCIMFGMYDLEFVYFSTPGNNDFRYELL